MKLIKKFEALLIEELFLLKHSKNPIQDYHLLLQEKYNEDNALANRCEGSGRNLILNEN